MADSSKENYYISIKEGGLWKAPWVSHPGWGIYKQRQSPLIVVVGPEPV